MEQKNKHEDFEQANMSWDFLCINEPFLFGRRLEIGPKGIFTHLKVPLKKEKNQVNWKRNFQIKSWTCQDVSKICLYSTHK